MRITQNNVILVMTRCFGIVGVWLSLLLAATPASAQTAAEILRIQPTVSREVVGVADVADPRLAYLMHDASHMATSAVLALALHLQPFVEMDVETSFLISTVALPVAQEVYDYVRYCALRRARGEPCAWSIVDSTKDLITYQGIWSLYLLHKRQYGLALLTAVAYGGFLYYWHYQR